MKNLVYILMLAILLSGCATVSSVSPKLSLGMSKQEVLAKCGRPTQIGAVQGADGRTFETFTYREMLSESFVGGSQTPFYTYVYFVDGKVIYYGNNPNMPAMPNVEQRR
jgi:uncharacterized protein YceK